MDKVIFTQNFKRARKADGSIEKVYEYPYTHVNGVLTDEGKTLAEVLEKIKQELSSIDISESEWDRLTPERKNEILAKYITVYICEDDESEPEQGGTYSPETMMITVTGEYVDGLLQTGGAYDPTTGLLTI